MGGERIGEWQLLRRLGQGGYAEVWEVRREDEKRTYALKRFRNVFSDLLDARCIVQEVLLFKFLKGSAFFPCLKDAFVAGVRPVFPFFEELAIVMQRAPGDLRQRMRGPPPSDVRPLLLGAIECVAALHAMGIAHRDLKPDNFLLGEAVLLTDFNHAGPAGLQPFAPTALGTRFYRAPELLLRQESDAAVDVWALGCVCAEILWWKAGVRGPPPFWGAECCTLSPGNKENVAPQVKPRDQLLAAVAAAGRQSPEEFDFVQADDARGFLLRFNKFRAGPSCVELLAARKVSEELLEVLRACLRPHPKRRLGAAQLLELPCFAGLPRRPLPAAAHSPLAWSARNVAAPQLLELLAAAMK